MYFFIVPFVFFGHNFGSSGLSVLACKEKEYLSPGLKQALSHRARREKSRSKKSNIHIQRAGGYEQLAPPQGREPFSLLQLAGMKK